LDSECDHLKLKLARMRGESLRLQQRKVPL
jgi:hypothetical protein